MMPKPSLPSSRVRRGRPWRAVCAWATLWLSLLPVIASAAAPPNFLVIVADDMGYSDAGCYGGEIRTPNLDRLARGGLRFTQFYSTARCWPSRSALLTGYYAQSIRRDELPGIASGGGGRRPAWARLLPEYLKPFGYRSYHSGKWHVDGPQLVGGFDQSYTLEDHNRNFYPQDHLENDLRLPPVAKDAGYYTTTAIADHAVGYLREHAAQHQSEPFFLYLAFTCPHFPLQALPQDIERYRDRYRVGWDTIRRERFDRLSHWGLVRGQLPGLDPDVRPSWNLDAARLTELYGPGEIGWAAPWANLTPRQQDFQAMKMTIHAAMVHRMDIEIGRVLQQLRSMGAFENTVVCFLSDNGASAEQIVRGDLHDRSAPPGSARTFLCLGPGWSSAANTPFRLHKSWVHEGGIASPLIVHWPAGIRARGELRHNPGHIVDLAPTLLELAGGRWPTIASNAPVPAPPGRSLAPVFARDGTVTHDSLWWFHDGNRALRVGDWKLVADHQGPWELYDLSVDRGESRNLAPWHPDKVRAMEQTWTRLTAEFRALALSDGQGAIAPAKSGPAGPKAP